MSKRTTYLHASIFITFICCIQYIFIVPQSSQYGRYLFNEIFFFHFWLIIFIWKERLNSTIRHYLYDKRSKSGSFLRISRYK